MLRNDIATEEQRERINKLRAEVSRLTATDTNAEGVTIVDDIPDEDNT